MPAVTMRQLEVFVDQVTGGTWQGDQSVWIASDDPTAETQWLPCAGDWMRAVHIGTATPATTPARRKAPTRKKTT